MSRRRNRRVSFGQRPNDTEEMTEMRESTFQAPFSILKVSHKVTNDIAVVELYVRIQDDYHLISGESRRAQGDTPNRNTGYFVALNRALEKLNSKVERRALGMVKHGDDMDAYRAMQQEQKEQEPTEKANKGLTSRFMSSITSGAREVNSGNGSREIVSSQQ